MAMRSTESSRTGRPRRASSTRHRSSMVTASASRLTLAGESVRGCGRIITSATPYELQGAAAFSQRANRFQVSGGGLFDGGGGEEAGEQHDRGAGGVGRADAE